MMQNGYTKQILHPNMHWPAESTAARHWSPQEPTSELVYGSTHDAYYNPTPHPHGGAYATQSAATPWMARSEEVPASSFGVMPMHMNPAQEVLRYETPHSSSTIVRHSLNDDDLIDARILQEVFQDIDEHHTNHLHPLHVHNPGMLLPPIPYEYINNLNTLSPKREMIIALDERRYASPTSSDATTPPSNNSMSMSSANKKISSSRICRVPNCTKGIRSRGLCKGHGGGRRCQTPGCQISDQGGGHCIAHGGGRRCSMAGCQKSAQSKGLCKFHGGARRCRLPNCHKNGQIKGLCRLHYSVLTSQGDRSKFQADEEAVEALEHRHLKAQQRMFAAIV